MSSSDVIALVALVVSIVSFAVTLYEQYLKRPKLATELGSEAYLCYGEGLTSMGATLAVSVLNAGASDAIVTRIEGTLARLDGSWSAPLIWQSFFAPTDSGQVGKSF